MTTITSGFVTSGNQFTPTFRVLKAIENGEWYTRKEIEELTGYSESMVRKILGKLSKANRVRRIRPSRSFYYSISSGQSWLKDKKLT